MKDLRLLAFEYVSQPTATFLSLSETCYFSGFVYPLLGPACCTSSNAAQCDAVSYKAENVHFKLFAVYKRFLTFMGHGVKQLVM